MDEEEYEVEESKKKNRRSWRVRRRVDESRERVEMKSNEDRKRRTRKKKNERM